MVGAKETKAICNESGGTRFIHTAPAERDRFALTFDHTRLIAASVERIADWHRKQHGYEYIDTEFVFDDAGKLYFVQARPATLDLTATTIDPQSEKSATAIYRGGMRVTRKACHGTIKIVERLADVQSGKIAVNPGNIVVTQLTWNEWTEYLRGMAGIVSEEGGTLSHPAILAREWEVPGIVSAENARRILAPYNGQTVTLDANRCTVYLDTLPLVEMHLDPGAESQDVVFHGEKRQQSAEIFMSDEDGTWVGRPKYELGKLQLDLYEKSLDLLADWLNVPPETRKVVDGVLYTKSGQGASHVERFTGMTLAELESVLAKVQSVEHQYLRASQRLTPATTKVAELLDLYIWINAFMNMNYCFNSVLRKRLEAQAVRMHTPMVFYEEALVAMENSLPHEDVRREVESSALLGELRQYNLARDPADLTQCVRRDNPRLFAKLDDYSKRYRFQRADLRLEPPYERVVSRLVEMVKNQAVPPSNNIVRNKTVYFPEDTEFQRTLELAVRAKIEGNNLHHTKVRGQWRLREMLLNLGQRWAERHHLPRREDVFELTLDEFQGSLARFG